MYTLEIIPTFGQGLKINFITEIAARRAFDALMNGETVFKYLGVVHTVDQVLVSTGTR